MRMASQNSVSVLACLLGCVIRYTDAETYHIAFLGRDQISTSFIGSVFIRQSPLTDISISSAVENCTSNVSAISLFDQNSTEFKIDAPGCSLLIPNGNQISGTGIKIESVSEMVVHVYQNGESENYQEVEGYLAIPDEYLGNEYYIVTYCSLGGICQFAVAGITNDTRVYVIFPDDVINSSVCVDGIPLSSSAPSGSAVPFEIQEFQVLHIESENDLTGTYIWSDQTVAVFAGARDVPTTQESLVAKAHLIEQLPPVNKWGTTFVAAPNYLNDAGDIIKIISQHNNTTVHILGFSPFNIPLKGGHIQTRIDWEMHSRIETSNPVLIVQVMSVDMYNQTSVITGTPAMVLVPHVEQWTDNQESPFYCFPLQDDSTLVAVVSDTINSFFIPVLPTPTVFYTHWSDIDGTDFRVQMFEPFSPETFVYGPKQSSYGFCDGTAALLLRANWTWENEGCIATAVTPGDGVDNDCDGEIDEDNCTADDLVTALIIQHNNSNGVNFETVNIRGAGYVKMKIKTCDVAMVTLQANHEFTQSLNIQISPTALVTEFCSSDCSSIADESLTTEDCNVTQEYVLKWQVTAIGLTHTFELLDNTVFIWNNTAPATVDYDQLIASAYAGTAEFEIDLPHKDCKKVATVFADTHGTRFLLPVHDTDVGFIVLISSRANTTSTVTIELDVLNLVGPIYLDPGKTTFFSNSQITETVYEMITLVATGGEISVSLFRSTLTNYQLYTQILPNDVLGPSYHLFEQSDTNETLTGVYCDAYATTRKANTNAGIISLGSNLEIDQAIYDDLGTSHIIKADRKLAVFCGTFTDTMLQMPPVETLGKVHYIPALNFTELSANAEVLVLATEDSTVVMIRGGYDQWDTINLKGEWVVRTLEENTIYNITATKPVQVHLQVRSVHWASAVQIPAVEQFKTDHVFPGLITDFDEIVTSYAVNASGSDVTSQITPEMASANAITYTYTDPTFSLTFMRNLNFIDDKYFIIPSDVFYNDINKVCTLTTGIPGDGVDNDCDGLIDEEQCSDSTTPGTVDFDIDGRLNEDCAGGTSATDTVVHLSISSSMIKCPVVEEDTSTISKVGINIGGTNTTDEAEWNIPLTIPIIPEPDTAEPFEPFVYIGPTIYISTNETEIVPSETCHTLCMCPCGWIIPQNNYSAEELAASVIEIQKKLAVKKEELSAAIRKKTSATDDRTSATAVGIVGLVFLVTVLGTVGFLDIATLFRDITQLAARIKSIF